MDCRRPRTKRDESQLVQQSPEAINGVRSAIVNNNKPVYSNNGRVASAILPTIPPSRSRYYPCDPSRPAINFQWTRQIFFRNEKKYVLRYDRIVRFQSELKFCQIEKLCPRCYQSTKLDCVLEKWIATGRKTVTRSPAGREKSERRLFDGNWPSRKSLFDSILNGTDSCIRGKPDKVPSLLCRRRIMRVFSPRFPRHRRITDLQRAATDVGLASLI